MTWDDVKAGFYVILIGVVVGFVIFKLFQPLIFKGNRQLLDTDNKFDTCITYLGGQKYEFEIDSWKDFEDGEQLQIKDKDGNIYLVSSFNTMLIKKAK